MLKQKVFNEIWNLNRLHSFLKIIERFLYFRLLLYFKLNGKPHAAVGGEWGMTVSCRGEGDINEKAATGHFDRIFRYDAKQYTGGSFKKTTIIIKFVFFFKWWITEVGENVVRIIIAGKKNKQFFLYTSRDGQEQQRPPEQRIRGKIRKKSERKWTKQKHYSLAQKLLSNAHGRGAREGRNEE